MWEILLLVAELCSLVPVWYRYHLILSQYVIRFLGLEYVNMELDDPFGDDPNDFPAKQMSLKTFEDIYITIYQVDGFESAAELRSRITDKIATS